jgi:hypothetical protein
MPDLRTTLLDGIVTGLAAAGFLVVASFLTGRGVAAAGSWLFIGGALFGASSAIWTIAGYRSPPGLVGLLRDDVEVYPSATKDSLWLDRFISARNVWLVAGIVMIAASYLPPFLS